MPGHLLYYMKVHCLVLINYGDMDTISACGRDLDLLNVHHFGVRGRQNSAWNVSTLFVMKPTPDDGYGYYRNIWQAEFGICNKLTTITSQKPAAAHQVAGGGRFTATPRHDFSPPTCYSPTTRSGGSAICEGMSATIKQRGVFTGFLLRLAVNWGTSPIICRILHHGLPRCWKARKGNTRRASCPQCRT